MQGKALFDAVAAAAQSFVGNSYAFNGSTYTLAWIASVTGPYAGVCNVGGVYGAHLLVKPGVDALIVRYSVAAGNGKGAVDQVNDLRVLTSASLPDNPTNAQLVAFAKQFLEDVR